MKRALGFMNKSQPITYNTYIGGVSATLSTDALLATKLGISVSNISNFTIVGSDIKCKITGSYSIPDYAFNFNHTPCTYYIDSDFLVTSIGLEAFYATDNFENLDANFENATTVAESAFRRTRAKNYLLKNATSIGDLAFAKIIIDIYTESIYIPNATTLGTTSGNNQVFENIGGGSFIYAHPSLATNNAGAPDGDLAYAITQGATVRYVTNFTSPLTPTLTSIGTIYNTAIQLVDAGDSTNAIDYFEVTVNGVPYGNVNAGSYITGLTPSTSYNITLIAVDIFYNKSVVSNSISVSTIAGAFPNYGLVSYYKLDSNSNDSYGSNNGTDTSVTYVSGKIGNAGSYNGTSSKSTIGNPANLQLATGTLSCWVKTSGGNTSYRATFGKVSAYAMYLKDNILILYDWGTAQDRTTGINLADGLWHHLVLVFDTGSNNDKVYVDGVLRLTTTMTAGNQTDNFCIGSSNSSQYLNGLIDECAVWNTALTQTDIDLLYNSGNGITL